LPLDKQYVLWYIIVMTTKEIKQKVKEITGFDKIWVRDYKVGSMRGMIGIFSESDGEHSMTRFKNELAQHFNIEIGSGAQIFIKK